MRNLLSNHGKSWAYNHLGLTISKLMCCLLHRQLLCVGMETYWQINIIFTAAKLTHSGMPNAFPPSRFRPFKQNGIQAQMSQFTSDLFDSEKKQMNFPSPRVYPWKLVGLEDFLRLPNGTRVNFSGANSLFNFRGFQTNHRRGSRR